MSIQNFPQVSVDTAKFDLPVFAPAVAPVRIPTKTYDLVVSLGTDVPTLRLTRRSPASCSMATPRPLSTRII